MRIERLKIQNYRQYHDIDIEFLKGSQNDLQVFIGKNGVGKTNLLNAINWCLYGDEPHLSAESDRQPIVNKRTLLESSNDEIPIVLVEIHTRGERDKPIVFKREKSLTVYSDRKNVHEYQTKFQVIVKDKKNNDVFIEGEEAISLVKRFVPETIREYFFFDGERLENYFKTVTGVKIQQEMMDISQIGLLQSMSERLGKLTKDFSKEAGKSNPDFDIIRSQLEAENNRKITLGKELAELETQIDNAKRRLGEIDVELKGIPDVESLEIQRDDIKNQINKKNDLIETKKIERNDLLYKHGISLLLQDPLSYTINAIREKRDSGDLPPTDDKDLLLSTLNNPTCKVCGSELNEKSREYIKNLLQRISLSSQVAHELQNMEPWLYKYLDQNSNYSSAIKKINYELNIIDDELAKLNMRKIDLDQKLESFNVDTVRKLQRERVSLENAKDTNLRRQGRSQTDIESAKKAVETLQIDLNKAEIDDEKSKILAYKSKFCNDAIQIVTSTKDQLLDRIRQDIEDETNKKFFELIWKKKTFKCVKIDPNYNVSLISVDDIPMLGSVGKAENELLALAFMLALHNVSGFHSPILIDTPVARVSDEQRENFGKILIEISKEKQIILLFTNDEYSDNIKKIISPMASNQYAIEMAPDEMSTTIEVI